MVFSRFWYLVLSAAVAAAVFLLYLATAIANRNEERTAAKLLTAASNAVGFYLKDDARDRATSLIPLALDPAVTEGLSKASQAASLSEFKAAERDKVDSALRKYRENENKREEGTPFDAVWAIDVHGRVLGNDNFDKGTGQEGFEMGGYAVVADAIHGWIRDDAWVLNGQIWRVVARPVEVEVGGKPVGAVVGGKVIDDRFVQAISDRTGAALAFYADRTRVATGAPTSFDKSNLEVHSNDIEQVEKDPDYQDKGRTKARLLRANPGYDVRAIFARMPGDAWDLGAGYVVGHRQATVRDPFELQRLAIEDDKKSVPLLYVVLAAVGAALLGLILSLLEHTLPLFGFRRAVADLGDKGSRTDVLKPSTFRGVYKKLAVHVNDALDKVASHAGVERGPADLQSVLGPLPAEPQMSAFALPKSSPGEVPEPPRDEPPRRKVLPKAPGQLGGEPAGEVAGPGAAPPAPGPAAAQAPAAAPVDAAALDDAVLGLGSGPPVADAAVGPPRRRGNLRAPDSTPPPPGDDARAPTAGGELDEESEWRGVYAEFVALKRQLGEPVDRLTYDKFRGTLQRNKDALVARHGCERVKFRVYEKQGRAALKASPVK